MNKFFAVYRWSIAWNDVYVRNIILNQFLFVFYIIIDVKNKDSIQEMFDDYVYMSRIH